MQKKTPNIIIEKHIQIYFSEHASVMSCPEQIHYDQKHLQLHRFNQNIDIFYSFFSISLKYDSVFASAVLSTYPKTILCICITTYRRVVGLSQRFLKRMAAICAPSYRPCKEQT